MAYLTGVKSPIKKSVRGAINKLLSNWLLKSGSWDDSGVWVDSKEWKDA